MKGALGSGLTSIKTGNRIGKQEELGLGLLTHVSPVIFDEAATVHTHTDTHTHTAYIHFTLILLQYKHIHNYKSIPSHCSQGY